MGRKKKERKGGRKEEIEHRQLLIQEEKNF